jgi:hypothetical protein
MAKVGIKRANYKNKEEALPFTTDYSTPRYPVLRLKDVESFTEEEALEQISCEINNGGIRAISRIVSRFNNNYRRKTKAEFNEAGISTVTSLIVEDMGTGTVTNFNMLWNYFHRIVNEPILTEKMLSAALRELVEEGYLVKKHLVTHEPFIDKYNRIRREDYGYGECYIRTNKQ